MFLVVKDTKEGFAFTHVLVTSSCPLFIHGRLVTLEQSKREIGSTEWEDNQEGDCWC